MVHLIQWVITVAAPAILHLKTFSRTYFIKLGQPMRILVRKKSNLTNLDWEDMCACVFFLNIYTLCIEFMCFNFEIKYSQMIFLHNILL